MKIAYNGDYVADDEIFPRDANDEYDAETIYKNSDNKTHRRKTGRAYRRCMRKIKNERLMKIISKYNHNPNAGYVDWVIEDGKCKPVGKYVKYPRNSNQQKYFKRYTNHVARKMELTSKGNGYRKMFEYWNRLY